MNILQTTPHAIARMAPVTPAALAIPVALMLALGGCTPADTPAISPAASTFAQVANSPQPTTPPPAPTTASIPAGIPTFGPGLYRLDLNEDQWLTCMIYESPGDVAICGADFPVTWKMMNGAHKQASRIIISQDDDGIFDVRADNKPMLTTRIMPTDITGTALISGVYVSVSNNEALFANTEEDTTGAVLITPDSYEVLSEAAEMSSAVTPVPAATVKATL